MGRFAGVESDPIEQLRVELGFDRGDRDVPSVARLVDVVEVSAAVENVLAAGAVADSGRPQSIGRGHERRGAVHHRGIDGLSLTGFPRLVQSRDDPEREVQRAATEVSNEIVRRSGRRAAPADCVQGARQRDVVQVVSGRPGERSVLSPSGHPAVDHPRIPGRTILRTEAETFGDAGPEPLDERVGAVDEAKHGLDAGGVLEIDRDARPAAVEEVEVRGHVDAEPGVGQAIDTHDVGAELGEEHRAHRTRSDARELDDSQSLERTHAVDLRRTEARATGRIATLERFRLRAVSRGGKPGCNGRSRSGAAR